MAKSPSPLDLESLASGITPGVTPAMGRMMAEAATVVLERNGHRSGIELTVISPRIQTIELRWPQLHADAKRAHRDLAEAAHYGAYAIALLLFAKLTDYSVIERSFQGTGIDYWLGEGPGTRFRRAARLEVSGIIRDPSRLSARVSAKMKQTQRSAGRLPAYVVVVEFGKPQVVWRKA